MITFNTRIFFRNNLKLNHRTFSPHLTVNCQVSTKNKVTTADYWKKMAEMVKTEEILGQKWDKCVLDAGIKMSSGLAIGKLFKK